MNLKKRFNSLDPKQKKSLIWLMIGILILIVTLGGYNLRSDKGIRFPTNDKTKHIQFKPDLIQKTMLREQRRQLNTLQETVDKIKNDQRRSRPLVTAAKEEPLPTIPTAEQVIQKAKDTSSESKAEEQKLPLPLPNPPQKEPQMIGEISILSNQTTVTTQQENESKKKGRTVYLPPSFMEARLLTGFDASTSGKGKNNPEPLLLRIQTPAVLPNDIKANLKGCFVIAEAVGRLDKERADVRLVSLSCLSSGGKAIIDTPVKGFVTDSDSKVGLAGRVVSRMGAATARTIVAGFFGGMGEMLKSAATTQSTSALGTTSSVNGSQIAKYSIGGGLSEGSQSLHDFYLTLAKQATPVIEVGASKKITVIISEGKELEIHELDNETL